MPRRVLQGTVVSDKANKTVIVSVERRIMHPIYKKFIKRTKRYAAHDEANACKTGDVVSIAAPELGRLVNEVVTCDQAEPWSFGTGALMANLARRGLLAGEGSR